MQEIVDFWQGLEQKTAVMGILNLTPDSFYAASRVDAEDLLRRAETMLFEGARVLDIGGMSTRPGAPAISEDEELRRVVPRIESLHKAFPQAFLSIDTYRSRVAQAAIDAGAHIVNDVSGGRHDPKLLPTVAALGAPYILMHSLGNSQTMQENPEYNSVVSDIYAFFEQKIRELQQLGIQNIALDVGFGFGKTIEHNYTLLKHLDEFRHLGYPILAGLSRKSMIYRPLQITPETALAATTALHLFALQRGARILRTHDVAEAVQAVRLWELLG